MSETHNSVIAVIGKLADLLSTDELANSCTILLLPPRGFS